MSFFKRQGPSMQDLTKKMVLSVVKTRAFPSWQQWRHLPQALTAFERRLAFAALATLGAAVLFLAGSYLVTHQTIAPAVGGEYTEGLIGSPQLINPMYAPLSDVDADLSRLVFSGLLKYDPHLGLVPDLAESYDLSDDGKTYTFVLRADATWHDGDPVTVSDVVGTFAMIQDPAYKSPLAVTFKDVRVEQVDERTVQFVLPEPFAPFLAALTLGILPGQIWDSVPPKNATLAEANLEPIGSGPYKFDKFSKDRLGNIRSYSLVRNVNYYGQPANIARLTFRFYPDGQSLIDALDKKNIQGASFVPEENVKDVEHDRDVHLLRPLLPEYVALFFNQIKNPLLKEPLVRQALTQALDRPTLVDTLLRGAATIEGPFVPGMVGAEAHVNQPPFDLTAAQTALAEAKTKLAEGTTLSLTITTIDNPEFMAVAQDVKNAWSALGLEVTINAVSADTLQSQVLKERQYDVLLSAELLPGDPDPYPFWHSSQVDYPGLNVALYANPEADKLIEQGRKATEPNARAEAYAAFQALLAKDMPAIFLYQPTYAYAVSGAIKGIDLPSLMTPADRFATITEWYLKTKHVLR